MLRAGGASSKHRRAVTTGSSACADDDREKIQCFAALALLRRHARELARPGDGAFEIEPERAHGRHQSETSEEIEPGGKASGIIFDPADGTRAEEAAEIADAV